MCFGGSQPKAPKVVYQGPSQDDIAQQQKSLDAYAASIEEQQANTAKALEQQIKAANQETADIQKKLDAQVKLAAKDAKKAEKDAKKAEAAAAAAGASYTPVGAYGVTTSETEASAAQTTEEIKPKKKPKGTLKISPSATTQAGSGLNIGV